VQSDVQEDGALGEKCSGTLWGEAVRVSCSKEFSRPDKVQEHQLVHVRRKHLLVVKAGEDGEEKVEVVKVGHDDQQLVASTPDHEDDEESPESE